MIKGVDYPNWMPEDSLKILDRGYLLPDETPAGMWRRVSKAVAGRLNKPELEDKFFEAMWNGWLCLATPVASNVGTERGLPISCFLADAPDSMYGIGQTQTELMMLTKYGGGVGLGINRIRGRGKNISNGLGVSEGVVPWAKIFDSTIVASNQGSIRRGAASVNLNVEHLDIEEFLRIRRPNGDVNRQCLNIHQCVQVTDNFMEKVINGDEEARSLWIEILRTRLETGEPYIHYIDKTNAANPEAYKKRGLEVSMTNICSEIMLHTDEDHTAVCCLSSLNISKYDEWKDTDLPYIATWFLDGVMQEFLERAKYLKGFEKSINSAIKGRPLGLGALGFHTYLQSKNIPLTGREALQLNSQIFANIKRQAVSASQDMAVELGEPEWCKGTGMRNTHVLAIAPTGTNSRIAGFVSPGIEPITANAYMDRTGKGSFDFKNKVLEKRLEELGKNTKEVWKSIVTNEGSVQHLDFLSEKDKEVFLTAREINQLHLVRLAAGRQYYIDQGQSLNLFFPANVDAKYFHKVHVEAWQLGVKTLYYCRSSSVLKSDTASRYYDEECKSCEG